MSHAVVRLLCAGALTIASTAVALSAAAPAGAVPSMSFVTASTPSDTHRDKSQTAHCPSGRRILGGGAYVSNGLGEVHVDELRPVSTAAGDSFVAFATAMGRLDGGGFRGSWSLTAYAICGIAPAGLEYVSARSTSGTETTHTVTAACPPGKRVIGAAGQVVGGFGFVILDEITPSAALTEVRVTGYQGVVTAPAPWRVDAFAICADPLPGLALVSAFSPYDSLNKTAVVRCPTGTKVHSLGHDVMFATGRASISAVFPSQPLDHARLNANEYSPWTAAPWQARLYAICAA